MALRAFDVVGIVERFDETLLLVADLSGLQHVLRRASELLYHPNPRAPYIAPLSCIRNVFETIGTPPRDQRGERGK